MRKQEIKIEGWIFDDHGERPWRAAHGADEGDGCRKGGLPYWHGWAWRRLPPPFARPLPITPPLSPPTGKTVRQRNRWNDITANKGQNQIIIQKTSGSYSDAFSVISRHNYRARFPSGKAKRQAISTLYLKVSAKASTRKIREPQSSTRNDNTLRLIAFAFAS